eukprot:6613629-Prorocentrum_lima.AAC.1
MSWEELADSCSILILTFAHDSYAGNLRLSRGLIDVVPPNVIVLGSRCRMQQLQIVLSLTYQARTLDFH